MLVMVADDSGKYMYQRTLPYKVSTRPQHKVEISKRCVFGLHRWYKWSKRPTGCNNNNLLIFKLAQHVSDNYLPIIRNARLWSTACVIMSPATCRSEARSAAARTMCSVCRMLLDKDYCVRCAGCCSTRAMCSVCRIFLDSRNILHTERRVLAAALWASDRHLAGDIITHAVNHSLALLMMGKELPGICWANLKISKLLLLHPVGHPLYLYSNEIKFSVQTNVQIMTSSNSLMEVKISR